MANCIQCGAKLPAFSFGEPSPYCKDCRARQASAEPGQLPPDQFATFAARPQAASKYAWLTATNLLIAVNVAVYLAMVVKGISPFEPTTEQMIQWGADFGPYTLGGQYWRLITSAFLHFGIFHLGMNMWCLWNLGQLAEKLLGKTAVAGVYFLTAVGSSLLSLSWHPLVVSAGASGAVFGIAGVLIPVLYFGKLNLSPESVRALLGSVVKFTLLNLVFGLLSHIDNMGHLGGLITGLGVGFFFARSVSVPKAERLPSQIKVMVAGAVCLFLLYFPVAKISGYAADLFKGADALEHHDAGTAVAHLQKYVAAEPDDAFGQVLLAEAYVEQSKPELAIPLFKKWLSGKPADAEGYKYFGRALHATGKLDEAEVALRASIIRNAQDAEAHRELAAVLLAQGSTAEAQRETDLANKLEQAQKAPASTK
ncbi:MAG: rhomboid family intramembrane serine protease [Acidobacteriia bacterium]|nr:rhomboid family intramembrane serine protease [Terriglobia bacterium]